MHFNIFHDNLSIPCNCEHWIDSPICFDLLIEKMFVLVSIYLWSIYIFQLLKFFFKRKSELVDEWFLVAYVEK